MKRMSSVKLPQQRNQNKIMKAFLGILLLLGVICLLVQSFVLCVIHQ